MQRLIALIVLIVAVLVAFAPDVSTPYSSLGILIREFRPLLELALPFLVIYGLTVYFQPLFGDGPFVSVVVYPALAIAVEWYFKQQIEEFLPQPMMSGAMQSGFGNVGSVGDFWITYGFVIAAVALTFPVSVGWYWLRLRAKERKNAHARRRLNRGG